MEQSGAWIEDAGRLDTTEQLIQFASGILEETPQIKAFLNGRENTKLILVAPKGYGKTLLIKSKRTLMQKANGALLCLPVNQFIDRPLGSPPEFSLQKIQAKLTDYQFWHRAWVLAIAICIVKAATKQGYVTDEFESKLESEFVRRTFASRDQTTALDALHELLQLGEKEFLRAAKDLNTLRGPYRRIHTAMALFIDNIDEYLEPYIDNEEDAAIHRFLFKNAETRVWVIGQIAICRAIRELAGINPHVKIFASIRKEAYIHLGDHDTTAENIASSVLDLEYDKDDLHKIFQKNISAERSDHLVDSAASDPMVRFVGGAAEIDNSYTGKQEKLFDFVLRHTLYRPRDLMIMGSRIAEIRPEKRTSRRVKEAVYAASKSIVRSYMSQMRGFLGIPDEHLFRLIPSNAMELSDLASIATRYRAYIEQAGLPVDDADNHPFCSLYRLGLLGIVRREGGELQDVQKFRRPHQIESEGKYSGLPKAHRYLVHPGLDDLIVELGGDAYSKNFHSENVIGDGIAWHSGRIYKCGVKGDLTRFSKLMAEPVVGDQFVSYLREKFSQVEQMVEYAKLSDGDAVILLDASAARAIKAAEALNRAVEKFQVPQRFRFGAAMGPVSYAPDATELPRTLSIAVAIRAAARLEPYARPGTLLLSEDVAQELRDAGLGDQVKVVDQQHLAIKGLEFDESGCVDLRKTPEDESVKTKLYELNLSTI